MHMCILTTFQNARSLLVFLKVKRYIPFQIERWFQLENLCSRKYCPGFLFAFVLRWPVWMRWIAVRRSFYIIGHIVVNYFIFIIIWFIIRSIQVRRMMNWWWFNYRRWTSRRWCIIGRIRWWAICKYKILILETNIFDLNSAENFFSKQSENKISIIYPICNMFVLNRFFFKNIDLPHQQSNNLCSAFLVCIIKYYDIHLFKTLHFNERMWM